MTPEQALQFLDGLTAQINLSRQQHAQVIIAVQTLQQALAPQRRVSGETSGPALVAE